MDILSLDVQTRDKSIPAKSLLKQDLIPAEYYGRGVENRTLQMDYQTFRRVFREAGMNTIIELNIDGGKEKINVLVHKVDYHPVSDNMIHVEFINVRMGEELHTKIPLEFTGMAPAVKELNGTLTTHISEIDVKCLPRDLIHNIEVDLGALVDFNAFIRVKDLSVPESITVLNEPEDVVATVVPPRVEEEPAGTEEEGEEGEEKKEGEKKEEGEEKKEEASEAEESKE